VLRPPGYKTLHPYRNPFSQASGLDSSAPRDAKSTGFTPRKGPTGAARSPQLRGKRSASGGAASLAAATEVAGATSVYPARARSRLFVTCVGAGSEPGGRARVGLERLVPWSPPHPGGASPTNSSAEGLSGSPTRARPSLPRGPTSPLERRRAAISGGSEFVCSMKNRRRPTLPGGCPPSTIGAERLNCSVRNGKRCLPFAMHHRNFARRSVELENCTSQVWGNRIKKHPSSPRTISTSRLRPLLDFYRWPINLVVYQGSYSLKGMGEFISRTASRLDAFSGYPFRA
jgi:hypothetical protein